MFLSISEVNLHLMSKWTCFWCQSAVNKPVCECFFFWLSDLHSQQLTSDNYWCICTQWLKELKGRHQLAWNAQIYSPAGVIWLFYQYRRLFFLHPIWVPWGAAMSVYSLLVKSKERLACNIFDTFATHSWCHSYKLLGTKWQRSHLPVLLLLWFSYIDF